MVSRQLGHANPNITAQVYAHLLGDEQLDQAAAAFEGLGAGSTDPGAAGGGWRPIDEAPRLRGLASVHVPDL